MKSYPSKLTTPPVITLDDQRGGFAYRERSTGIPFAFNTWAELIGSVMRHRQAMSLDLADGWQARFEDDFCSQNPHLGCQDDAKPATFDTPLAITGRALWGELHAYTETYPATPNEQDKALARYWMANWRERIPRFGGCSCREDWARLEASYPPDYTNRQSLVTWARIAHDAVSRKIGKPLFYPDLFNEAVAKGFNVFA